MDIYSQVKAIAKRHGRTVKEVAKDAGIGENSIYRWRTHRPSVTSLQKVASVLHVAVEYLTRDINTHRTVDLNDDKVHFTFNGRPVTAIEMKYIRRLLTPEFKSKQR